MRVQGRKPTEFTLAHWFIGPPTTVGIMLPTLFPIAATKNRRRRQLLSHVFICWVRLPGCHRPNYWTGNLWIMVQTCHPTANWYRQMHKHTNTSNLFTVTPYTITHHTHLPRGIEQHFHLSHSTPSLVSCILVKNDSQQENLPRLEVAFEGFGPQAWVGTALPAVWLRELEAFCQDLWCSSSRLQHISKKHLRGWGFRWEQTTPTGRTTTWSWHSTCNLQAWLVCSHDRLKGEPWL